MRVEWTGAGGWLRRVREVGPIRVGLVVLASLGQAGCGDSTRLGRAGLDVSPPEGWAATAPGNYVVPGTPIAAWTGPGGSSLNVFTTLPIPRPDAAGLAIEQSVRLENLPGLTIISAREQAVDGFKAAWVEVVGPGTGDAFVPSGMGRPVAPAGKALVPTRRVMLTLPRRADTLTLLWHYPDSARALIEPQVQATIRSLRVADAAAATSSY